MSSTYRAFVAGTTNGAYSRTVREIPHDAELAEDSVRINVAYSDVNYKDYLAATENGKVARIDPIVPGIDLAGTIADGATSVLPVGQAVLAHGYEIGVARNGGFAEVATVPAASIIQLPNGMDAQQAMTIGTAGFTAALSVQAIVNHGVTPADGQILVTGATGGVGSVATALLGKLGYEVVASTGRTERSEWLTHLGAAEVRDRLPTDAKPLGRETWAGVVDSVGGTTLHAALASVKYGGIVAASGNTGGFKLATTVFPFILRGVQLSGIDSVACALETRQAVWNWISANLDAAHYDLLVGDVVDLDGLDAALNKIADGSAEGRTLVRPFS